MHNLSPVQSLREREDQGAANQLGDLSSLGSVKDRCIARVFDQIVDPLLFGDSRNKNFVQPMRRCNMHPRCPRFFLLGRLTKELDILVFFCSHCVFI